MLGGKAEPGSLSQVCRSLAKSDTADLSLTARDLSDLVCKNRGGLQSRAVVTGGWGRGGNGEFLPKEYRVSAVPDERVPEMDGSDSGTTVGMC